MRSNLLQRTVLAVSILIVAVATPSFTHAQTSTRPTLPSASAGLDPIPPNLYGLTGHPLLFVRSRAFLATADKLCDVPSCHDAVAAVLDHVGIGENLHESNRLVGAEESAWAKTFDELMHNLQFELGEVLKRQAKSQPVSYLPDPNGPDRKPCLKRVGTQADCDRTFAMATAICALWTLAPVVGPACAIICEAAAIVGYNQCLVATQNAASQG